MASFTSHDYGLPPIPTNEFTLQRVMTTYFIYWVPKEGFWYDVMVAQKEYTEWKNRKFGTEFNETFRSHYGFKDKATAEKGMKLFVGQIEEDGKKYIDGQFTIKEESLVDNQSQA